MAVSRQVDAGQPNFPDSRYPSSVGTVLTNPSDSQFITKQRRSFRPLIFYADVESKDAPLLICVNCAS